VNPIRRIVIVGGGTAGWMSAAALSKLLLRDEGLHRWEIELVESDEIGIIGVGEATIPAIKAFNTAVGISEDEFLRETQGTFKLGIEFVNWGGLGQRYFHGFAPIGQPLDGIPFHHHWLRLKRAGAATELDEYAINNMAPRRARFMRPRADMAGSPLAEIAHAFHFDAGRYARYLRRLGEQRGVKRTEGRIQSVQRDAESGLLAGLTLADGRTVRGDFFFDCSGLHALLIDKTLGVPFEDWTHWLPCDRAQAVPCASAATLLPHTRSTAHGAGWQWRIPLQHRIGNGHVYSSSFLSDDDAARTLLSHLDGQPLAEPRVIRFRTGRRATPWVGNCLAVGLSSGFLEPLESTSIHLVQSAITRFMDLFPHGRLDAVDIDEYNRQAAFEMQRIRDFIVLHYKLTARSDTEFWNYCRNMPVPDTLQAKMALFASNGRIYREGTELFTEASWLQVMLGQGLEPRGYHPLVEQRSLSQVGAWADNLRDVTRRCVDVMPMHADFIAANCAATSHMP
jgi:tryptophan 7-halogenase